MDGPRRLGLGDEVGHASHSDLASYLFARTRSRSSGRENDDVELSDVAYRQFSFVLWVTELVFMSSEDSSKLFFVVVKV